jgi:hypothetical protein
LAKPLQKISKSFGALSIVPVKGSFAYWQFALKGHLPQIFSSFILALCLMALEEAMILWLVVS